MSLSKTRIRQPKHKMQNTIVSMLIAIVNKSL